MREVRRGAYLLLASRDRQLPLPRIRYLGLQFDIDTDEIPVVCRENFPRQVAESVGLALGPLLAWWGLNRGGQDPDPLDLTVFVLSFLVLAVIPSLLSPRAFRWTLLLSGSALLAFRIASIFLDTQPLAKEIVVALGVLATGLFVTPRTQWLLAVARWLLALGIIAMYATLPFRDVRGTIEGGALVILSPVLFPLVFLCVWKSRRLFKSDGQDWAYRIEIPGAPSPAEDRTSIKKAAS